LMPMGEVQRLLSLNDPDGWLAQHPPRSKLQWDMNLFLRRTLDDALAQLVNGADTAADEAQLDLLLGTLGPAATPAHVPLYTYRPKRPTPS
jgi:hypothetical protein